jgi:hypothetical protein
MDGRRNPFDKELNCPTQSHPPKVVKNSGVVRNPETKLQTSII